MNDVSNLSVIELKRKKLYDYLVAGILAALFLLVLFFVALHKPTPMVLLLTMGLIGAIRWPVATLGFFLVDRMFSGVIITLLLGVSIELEGQGYFLVDLLPIAIATVLSFLKTKWSEVGKTSKVVGLIWVFYTVYALVSLYWSPVTGFWRINALRGGLLTLYFIPGYIIGLGYLENMKKFMIGILIQASVLNLLFLLGITIPLFSNLVGSNGVLVGTTVHINVYSATISSAVILSLFKNRILRIGTAIIHNIITIVRMAYDGGRFLVIAFIFSHMFVLSIPNLLVVGVSSATFYQVLSFSGLDPKEIKLDRIEALINPEKRDYAWNYRDMTRSIFFERVGEVPVISGFGVLSFGSTGWSGVANDRATMHNAILETYWEFGLMGSIPMLICLLIFFWSSWYAFVSPPWEMKRLARATFSIGANLMLMSWVTTITISGTPFFAALWVTGWLDHARKTKRLGSRNAKDVEFYQQTVRGVAR